MGSIIQVPMFRFRGVWVWDLSFQAPFLLWAQQCDGETAGTGTRGRQGGTERFPNPNSQLYQHRFCSPSLSCIRRFQSPLSSLYPSSVQISTFTRTETNAAWHCRPVLFIKFATVIFFFLFLVFSSFIPHFLSFLQIALNLIVFLVQINAVVKFWFYDWRIKFGSKKSVLIPENL